MANCVWCGDELVGGNRLKKSCSHSHQQMAWAIRHYAYRRKQVMCKRRYSTKNHTDTVALNKKLTFIVAAMMLHGEINR